MCRAINLIFFFQKENVQKHRGMNLLATEKRRNYLVSEPIYQAAKFFGRNLLIIDMKKSQVLINRSVYLGLPILENSNVSVLI